MLLPNKHPVRAPCPGPIGMADSEEIIVRQADSCPAASRLFEGAQSKVKARLFYLGTGTLRARDVVRVFPPSHVPLYKLWIVFASERRRGC